MPEIEFAHNYPKLHGQKTAYLIHVESDVLARLSQKLIEYDTQYIDADGTKRYYQLSGYFMLVLYFMGDYGIPFTTIRKATTEKQRFYQDNIGEKFQITILPEGGPKNG